MITKAQQKLIRSLEQKKYRQREGLFVAEGPKVVGDLMAAGFEPVMTFDDANDVKRLSFQQHPQGVLAVFRIPNANVNTNVNAQPSTLHTQPSTLTLALDGIQDPGNLGTIIRIADWFGIDTIFCSPDTADAWAPKVVQATMGSIARVHIIYMDLHVLLDEAEAAADAPLFPDAAARRLGWLLDAFGAGAPDGIASYCATLASEPSFLSPASARTGKLDAKWRIIVNEEVDPDI